MTAPTPTPDDVARLVYITSWIEKQPEFREAFGNVLGNLDCALAPFRPDPDAELIEAMLAAYVSARDLDMRDGMRAAIAVYRAREGGGK